ncbi:hypothetical protein [Zymobacter palmae]|uniref:RTX toxins and related Ca2+-binding proteins n=1 Tax=Zymobacter palmae TaxID=33074 RepID=A0A348HEG4_9GAMM|nr:hypothetical protein [Zymobacter palmae]BBG30016.1 RTX toxins and related Ca2+-binding proteins [Zymobacter palmae]
MALFIEDADSAWNLPYSVTALGGNAVRYMAVHIRDRDGRIPQEANAPQYVSSEAIINAPSTIEEESDR